MTYSLKAAPENKINGIIAGKRKRQVGLLVPAKYVILTKSKTFANILLKKLQEKERSIESLKVILSLLL